MKLQGLSKLMCIVVIGISILCFNACKKKNDPVPEEPALSIGMPNGDAAPAKLEISSDGGSQKLAIVSNSAWKITKQGTSTDWVMVSPQEGSQNGEITITVAKNVNVNPRELTLNFTVDGQNLKTYTVSQLGFGPNLSVTPTAPEAISKDGSDITFTITSNDENWTYTLATGSTWLTQKSKTATTLTLTAAKNTGETRSSEITFNLPNYPSVIQKVTVSQQGVVAIIANMLDVQFNLDGSATDLSPMKNPITKVSFDQPFTVSLNSTYNRNMVTFDPANNGVNPGANKGSFYRVDYLNNPSFKSKLASSHSFECLVKFDVDYTTTARTYETKFFSTQEAGGTGLMIANSTQTTGPNGITFLPNVPATEGGASRWIWTNSQVKPDGQSWYHIVGIWDKTAAKAFIYINGVKKSEVDATGFFRHVNADAINWVGIGGDPGGDNIIQQPFKGSMAIARIYDKALSATEVDQLWGQVKP